MMKLLACMIKTLVPGCKLWVKWVKHMQTRVRAGCSTFTSCSTSKSQMDCTTHKFCLWKQRLACSKVLVYNACSILKFCLHRDGHMLKSSFLQRMNALQYLTNRYVGKDKERHQQNSHGLLFCKMLPASWLAPLRPGFAFSGKTPSAGWMN